jgi:hypothetical protein
MTLNYRMPVALDFNTHYQNTFDGQYEVMHAREETNEKPRIKIL